MALIGEKLSEFPRRRFALLPTPVHALENLSALWGCRVWCKRDDLTGFGFGGNKARKLDFLIAHALSSGADTLLAVGGAQSNFCRMTAAAGSAAGLDVRLVLGGGRPPRRPTGNLLLIRLLGAACLHLDSPDWGEWETRALELERRLAAEGRKVYRMPVGGSTPVGALGYVEAFSEIMEDQRRLGVDFDVIIHSSSSAGTQAGLVAGKSLARWPGRILGVSAAKPAGILRREVLALARETAGILGGAVQEDDVLADDRHLGSGYAARTAEADAAVRLFARSEGIFLDHVYTGKAAAALADYIGEGAIGREEKVLFIHTGGNAELFA